MKIYIAGKITGLKNYKENFNRAEEKLRSEGHLCMNPSVLPEGFPWTFYLPICYSMIDACDAIYMLNNWTESKGAKLELDYAQKHNKQIIFEGARFDKFTVIKNSDIEKYLATEDAKELQALLRRLSVSRKCNSGKKENTYLVINTNEIYAAEIIEIMKEHGHWG